MNARERQQQVATVLAGMGVQPAEGSQAALAGERERLLDEAVAARKFGAERKEVYRAAFGRDFDGTKALLERLMPIGPVAGQREQVNRVLASAGVDLRRQRGGRS